MQEWFENFVKKKSKERGILILLRCQAIVMKTVWFCIMDRQINQWKRTGFRSRSILL